MNDRDVLVSKGKESLRRLYEYALGGLDLDYTADDIVAFKEDARLGMEWRSEERVRESLNLFLGLLGFEPMLLKVVRPELQVFGRPAVARDGTPAFEDLVLFNVATLSLGLRRGHFSPSNDLHLAWVIRYAEGLGSADLQGMDVFEYLAELAMAPQLRRGFGELFIEPGADRSAASSIRAVSNGQPR